MGLMTVGDPSHTVQPPEVEYTELDFNKDNDIDDGKNTSGIFNDEGVILTIEPDVGDTSYILGPMASMYYGWWSGGTSTIGYIRESDRKMVNLGTVPGVFDSWDGTTGFNSYGQLTLEQAQGFKNTPKKNDYRAFYPGPPSNTPDAFGRYLCQITSTPKEFEKTPPPYVTSPTQGPESASDQFSALLNRLKDKAGDIDWDQVANAINLGMVALDVIAVIGILFPEPGTSIAGAARLATRFAGFKGIKQSLKNRFLRGALNPLGQRTVRSGAAGRVRQQVYSGRTYKGTRGFGKTTYGTTDISTGRTYTNPGPLKGLRGTGGRTNPKGTLDRGTLPQRYIDKYGSRSVTGQQQIKLGKKAAKRVFGNSYDMDGNFLFESSDQMDSKIDMAMAVAGKLGEKDLNAFFEKLLDYLDDAIENENVTESTQTLSESKRRILREIKKPYKVPKTPTKFKGIRPKVRVTGKGLMEVPEIPKQFKPEPTIWRKPNYDKNVKASQEKKNEVLEYVGAAADHWEYLTETRRKEKNAKRDAFYSTKKDRDFLYDYWYGGKKHKVTRKEDVDNDCLVYIEDEDGKKFSMLQSKLNEMLEEEKMKDAFDSYIPEEEQGEREKNFDKVTKLKSIVGKIKRGDIGPEYPNEPPPELVNGWHPKLGKKYKHDKLDPQSAEAMPDTGDPEIDANIKKATDANSKARKLKTLLGKKA